MGRAVAAGWRPGLMGRQGLWSGMGRWMGVCGLGVERGEQWWRWEWMLELAEVAQSRLGGFQGHDWGGIAAWRWGGGWWSGF